MRQATSTAPKRGSRRIIERPRLLRLLEGTAARTILLVAPAGFGKTTLARQWAARHEGIHWYSARTGSADIAQLAVDLAAVFAGLSPGLEEFVSQLVRARPSPARQAVEIVDGFAGAAGAVRGATLVIDDFHLIAEDDVAATFVHGLQQRLDLRLVVASRVRPSWAAARFEVYGDSVELGADELALTDDEAHEILGRSARAGGLVGQARGWPAVVGLAAQAGEGAASPPDAADSALFRFFAEELFLATPVELQEKLITLALLPTLAKPIVDAALGADSDTVIDAAIESGLAGAGPEGAELHPLVREFLFTKLRGRPDADARVRAAFELSLDAERWDHAFELMDRFAAAGLLEPLVERSFKALLSSGRVATLERVAGFAHAHGVDASPLIGLIDAELAFRSGSFGRAEVIAERAAIDLGSGHAFESHAWWVAGQAAQLSFEDARAVERFSRAREAATDDEAARNALWGLTMTHFQSEERGAPTVVAELTKRRALSPIDLVRSTQSELLMRRATSLAEPVALEEALHALSKITDPRVTTSFMNVHAYHQILTGYYDDGHETATAMHELVENFQLTWAKPHAHWALAASAIGRRSFRDAEVWLRRVEIAADQLRYGQLILNAGCLRARMLLALQRPGDALSALEIDDTQPASKAMRGEYLTTRALVSAIAGGPLSQCEEGIHRALALTTCVEARAYGGCAKSIATYRADGDPASLLRGFLGAQSLGVWDAIVVSIRADPSILPLLVENQSLKSALTSALRRSHDYDLARRAGIDLGRRPTIQGHINALTPREREVLDLIRGGSTNREIARTLFISETTVKVHVRHILEKTGARTRTEAATMFLD